MADTVMTMGRSRVTALLRGTDAAPIGGDFREIPFICQFSANAVNSGEGLAPEPRIMVTVSTTVPEHLFSVEIIPPGGKREVLVMKRSDGRPVSWARRVVLKEGRPQVEPRSAARGIIDGGWEFDDPFGGVGDLYAPVDPIGPGQGGGGGGGGGAQTYIRVLDPATDETGPWTVRVRNRDQVDQQFIVTVDHPETVQILQETRIPFQLIYRAFAQALLSMQLRIHIDNGQARIQFDRTFRQLTGIENQIISVNDRLQDINLQQFTVNIGNEAEAPTIVASLDLEDRGDEIGLPGPNVNADDLAISCSIRLEFGYPRHDFFETAMRRENGQIVRRSINVYTYLDAHPNISGLWASFADAILTVSGALGITSGSSIDDYVQDAIDNAEHTLYLTFNKAAPYFQDVIMHLVDRNAVLFRLTADDDAIVVQHHHRPNLRDFIGVRQPAEEGSTRGESIDKTVADKDSGPAVPLYRGTQSDFDALSNFPATVATRASSTSESGRGLREGEIDHIVVLMMENRSFDHMLGYRKFTHPDVNGLTGTESNPFPYGPPYDVYHLPVTAGLQSPDHGYEATLEQIAGGSMNGFVRNYVKRSGVVDPGVVMGFYDDTDLPTYEFLANNFATCDAWHSAHLGETQCNRFAALTGVTPELTNLELSDQRLGYYRGRTIFDYLSEVGVDWVYAEGNIAFLRVFDKYRLDISHVIPYQDDYNQRIEDTFVKRVGRGDLPSVSFIDPRYIDVPPAWDANDDLPPADVCRGQQLVSHVYSLLSTAKSTWPKTLLLVTYDEHGGFFDHATPLGMANSHDPTPFPAIHPDGPHHLGVRVPAFVVSPWVDGGTVFHTPYDHTSILKTILQRFAPASFPIEQQFGPRAAAAKGLLTEQLRTSARRQDPPEAPSVICKQPIGPKGPSAGLDTRDFHLAMRLLGLPAKYRDRAAGNA